MSQTKTKAYIRAALHRHYKVDDIMANLIAAGHNEETVRRLTKELLRERIAYLEKQKRAARKAKPMDFDGVTLELLFSLLLRVGLGLIGAVGVGYIILQGKGM